jgi:hypothetical protein
MDEDNITPINFNNATPSKDKPMFDTHEVLIKEITEFSACNGTIHNRLANSKKRKNPFNDNARCVKPYRVNRTQKTIYGDEHLIDLNKLRKNIK